MNDPLFTPEEDRFNTLIGNVGTLGYAALSWLYFIQPRAIEDKRLMRIVKVKDLRTLLNALDICEAKRLASCVDGKWHITDIGADTLRSLGTQAHQLKSTQVIGIQYALPLQTTDLTVEQATPDQTIYAADHAGKFPALSDQIYQINSDQSIDQSDLINTDQTSAEKIRDLAALQAALDQCGIKEPAVTRIKADPTLTADHVRAAYAMAAERSSRTSPIGLCVYLLTKLGTTKEIDRLQRAEINRRAAAIAADRIGQADLMQRAQRMAESAPIDDVIESSAEPTIETPATIRINPIVNGNGHGMSPAMIWQATIGELQVQMTKATFDTYIRPTRLIDLQDGRVFIVHTESVYIQDWLQTRLYSTIKRILHGISGQDVDVKFIVGEIT